MKPKILVAGLLPRQSQRIEKRIGKAARLVFWNKEESQHSLTTRAMNADVCILAVNFLAHQDTECAKKGAKKIVRAAGGMGSIEDEIWNQIRGA